MFVPFFLSICLFFVFLTEHSNAQDAIPEPAVIFYGPYTASGDSTPSAPTSLSWRISGNSESAEITNFTLVTVNSETYYLVHIPFETRKLGDDSNLDPTPNSLALTDDITAYTRTVEVNGEPAFVSLGKENFTYGRGKQGHIERVPVTAAQPESFEDWSIRIFGRLIDPDGDEDGDGYSNIDEYLAGTDPKDANSGLLPSDLTPLPGGGFRLDFQTVGGIRYQFEKATGPEGSAIWTSVGPARTGTGTIESFTAPHEPGQTRMFYRVRVIEP